MKVRHIAASYRGAVIAVGAFERDVHTWNVRTGVKLAAFETDLDFGGTRLAIDPTGRRCAAAAYTRFGLSGYQARNGRSTWRRPDVKKVQSIQYSPSGDHLYCRIESGPCLVLDAESGMELERHRGVRQVWESPFGTHALFDRRIPELRAGRAKPRRVERTTFAILAVAFSPSSLCVSEAGGSLRCLDLDGVELWRYVPPEGHHVIDVAYCGAERVFVGVALPYEKGGPRILLRWEAQGGSAEVVRKLPVQTVETAFLLEGSRLITSQGLLLKTTEGKRVAALAF